MDLVLKSSLKNTSCCLQDICEGKMVCLLYSFFWTLKYSQVIPKGEIHLRTGRLTEISPNLLSWQKQTAYGEWVKRLAFQFCWLFTSPVPCDLLKYRTVSTPISWEENMLRMEYVCTDILNYFVNICSLSQATKR